MSADDFFVFRNIGLPDSATADQTSTVGEPTVSNRGKHIFLTGNWYATTSSNNGDSWQHINPFKALPSTAGGFCCDQVTHYDHSRDMTIWLLQYSVSNNTNVLRIAINRGPGFGNGGWYWWDFSPVGVNTEWNGEWFDYPDLALSNNYLYVTTNVFSVSTNRWTRAVIFKLPLDTLAAGTSLGYQYFSTTSHGSLRCAQGAKDTIYFASHNSSSSVRIFSWPENSNSVNWNDINITPWSGSISAPGADGTDWLARADSRITGGWVAKSVIGFMWTVGKNESRPWPHVRVIRVDERSKTLIDQPDIWSKNAAFAYPAVGPNDRGDLGLGVFFGGNKLPPSFVVGMSDDVTNPGRFELAYASKGTNGPTDDKWGDYITCNKHSPDGLTWIASGYTLRGGGTRRSIVPRVIHFGRRRARRATEAWSD